MLREMLNDFNEGRSKSYYCIAATVLELDELEEALSRAREESGGGLTSGRGRRLFTGFSMRSLRGEVTT
ncbi:hypothetical protein [Methanoculleus chikugoensis]|uniref:hypothetical protein n=1 Tax=Methanoculleus chikugoensis TaxID=118126 RepID=UPI001FB1C159|nr:hypothetical protein [Methanoculleus chikugoensis]